MVHLDRKEVYVNSARLTNRGVAYYTAVCETSFNSDFLPNTKTRVGRAIAIPPPFGHDTKY